MRQGRVSGRGPPNNCVTVSVVSGPGVTTDTKPVRGVDGMGGQVLGGSRVDVVGVPPVGAEQLDRPCRPDPDVDPEHPGPVQSGTLVGPGLVTGHDGREREATAALPVRHEDVAPRRVVLGIGTLA